MLKSNGKKIAMRTLAIILAVVMSVTMLAFSASAEDASTEAAETTEQVYVWAPFTDVHEKFVTEVLNPATLNPEFSWEVIDRRYDRDDRYVCTEYTASGSYGALTVPADSALHSADTYAKSGLYHDISHNFQTTDLATARKNQIRCKVRQLTDMYLVFTAPMDGYYTIQASAMIRNATSSAAVNGSMYVAKVDKATGNETIVKGFETVGTNGANVVDSDMAGADLKAGDQLVLGASCTGGTAIVSVYDLRVSLNPTALSEDNATVTTSYKFMGSDQNTIFGQLRATGNTSKNTNWFSTMVDTSLWDIKATLLLPGENTDSYNIYAYSEEKDFKNPGMAERFDTFTSSGQFTYNWSGVARLFYNNTAKNYNANCSGNGPLLAVKYVSSNGVMAYYGARLYFKVPASGTATLTHATPLTTGGSRYRVGIIRNTNYDESAVTKNGDGTEIEYLTNFHHNFVNSTATPFQGIGEVCEGDVLVYEIFSISSTEQVADLTTLAVNITTEVDKYDITGDRNLNAFDAAIIRRYIMGFFGEEGDLTYDLNGDEASDLKDLVFMKKRIAGIPV